MTIHNLSDGNSVLNQFIAEIRDKNIQKNHMRFRRNLERIGEIFAYEISKTLRYRPVEITTPLGISTCSLPEDEIVLATILRAGLPLHNGLLNYFDGAQNAFIAAYRKCNIPFRRRQNPDSGGYHAGNRSLRRTGIQETA